MAKKKMTLEEKLEEAIVKEIPYKVPKNWIAVKFGSILNFEKGKKPKLLLDKFEEGAIPYVTINCFQTGKAQQYTFLSETNRLCTEDDILIVWDGARAGLVGKGIKGALGSTLCRVNSFNINKKYLYYYFESKYDLINKNTKGTGIPHVNPSFVNEMCFNLPPIKEQERIVEKIESLFDKLDKAKELIEEAREEFKNRKAAILEKAFEGKFTEKYRKRRYSDNTEALLLSKKYYNSILTKKEMKIMGELQVNTNVIEGLGWLNTFIGALCKVSNGATPSRKILEYWNGEIPWVSSGEVDNCRIKFTKEAITEKGFDNSSVKLLKKGTVLIAMIGEGKTRAQSAILDIDATINQNIAAIDTANKQLLPEFLYYWLIFNYKKNRNIGNGTGPKALNCQRVRELRIKVPNIDEQKEIVRILDKLLEDESKIEELTNLEEQIELIKKSILAKAFRGELGTNNPEEDSARELLKEILSNK